MSGVTGGAEPGAPNAAGVADVVGVALRLALPGSPVSAVLYLDAATATPQRLTLETHSGGVGKWGWPRWPHHVVHVQSTGQREEYLAEPSSGSSNSVSASTSRSNIHDNPAPSERDEMRSSAPGAADIHGPSSPTVIAELRGSDKNGDVLQRPPPSPGPPPSSAPLSVEVDVCRCEGGQFLLRGQLTSGEGGGVHPGVPSPTLAGKPGGRKAGTPLPPLPGWFILDPCCDTSAVTAAAADAAGLPSFGQQV